MPGHRSDRPVDVHNLGLTAMEVQLVRVNLNERFASEEEIGHTIRDVAGEIVVRISRQQDRRVAGPQGKERERK